MREIKFRAWDKVGKIMLNDIGVHPFITQLNDGYKLLDAGSMIVSPKMTEYEIMRFTGLLDRQGKEIWEFDIVTFESNMGEETAMVFWANNLGSFALNYIEGKSQWHDDGDLISTIGAEILEVIGNIYENGDLLCQ